MWEKVSIEAKDFLDKLMQYSPERRITPNEALNHPWILKYSQQSTSTKDLACTLGNLMTFRTQMT